MKNPFKRNTAPQTDPSTTPSIALNASSVGGSLMNMGLANVDAKEQKIRDKAAEDAPQVAQFAGGRVVADTAVLEAAPAVDAPAPQAEQASQLLLSGVTADQVPQASATQATESEQPARLILSGVSASGVPVLHAERPDAPKPQQ